MLLAILIKGMTLGGIYFMISFGVTFLYGVGGFPNLAIGPIGLAGAYVTATLLRSSMHPIWAIWVGLGCSILVGIAIQKLVVEPLYNSGGGAERGRVYVIYGTFGLCLLLPAIFLNLFESTMMHMRFPNLGIYKFMGVSITGYQLLTILLAISLLIITHTIFNKTLSGNRVRAVTQNPFLSRVIGIKVSRIYLTTAIISSACAYGGAVLWGEIFGLELGSGLFFTLYGFIIAVMGGLGSIYGAFLVSLFLGIVLSASSFLIGGVWDFIMATTLLILVLILRPMGVIPTRREV